MQNRTNAFIFSALALAVLAIVTIVASGQLEFLKKLSGQAPASSFEECIQISDARILETYPRQCVIDSYTFTELTPDPDPNSVPQAVIELDEPDTDSPLRSPVTVKGYAPGTWFFEASMQITLQNDKGEQLASGIVTAQTDWMTTKMVEFTGKLTFTNPPSGTEGRLIFHKENPSGDPERDEQVSIPVIF